MNNTDKLLRAFIDAMGYEVEEVDINPRKHDRYPSEPIINYKVTKKVDPLDEVICGVILRVAVQNITSISYDFTLEDKDKWIKYPKELFYAVVGYYGDEAKRANEHRYNIIGVEVSLDEKDQKL